MWVTIYLEDRDEIKWSIEERLEAARPLHRTVPCTIQQPRRGAPAKTLDPTFILLVHGALSLLGLEPGPLNGVMAEQTRTAIREFQRREKLAADGVPGQATCLALATGLYRKLDCCDLLGQGQHGTLGPGQILCQGQGGA
jgi:Putative peptidoglycan binding domain